MENKALGSCYDYDQIDNVLAITNFIFPCGKNTQERDRESIEAARI